MGGAENMVEEENYITLGLLRRELHLIRHTLYVDNGQLQCLGRSLGRYSMQGCK